MWVTKTTLMCLPSMARTTCRAISDPSRSFVAERFVAEQDRAGRDLPGDLAHPGEFLVELAALHRDVLFTLVVREDTGAHASAERLPADEHAAVPLQNSAWRL